MNIAERLRYEYDNAENETYDELFQDTKQEEYFLDDVIYYGLYIDIEQMEEKNNW